MIISEVRLLDGYLRGDFVLLIQNFNEVPVQIN